MVVSLQGGVGKLSIVPHSDQNRSCGYILPDSVNRILLSHFLRLTDDRAANGVIHSVLITSPGVSCRVAAVLHYASASISYRAW